MKIRYVNFICDAIINEVHENNHKMKNEKIEFIRNLCRDNRLKSILKEIDMKGYTIRKRIILTALKNQMALFLYLYYKLVKYVKKV